MIDRKINEQGRLGRRAARHGNVMRRAGQRGNVMLEMALIFLVFFGMLLGTFDFGQFLFVHQALVERARWALRYSIANHTASQDSGADSTDNSTCAAETIAACAQNEMLYYAASGSGTGYFGLSNATTTQVSVTTISQTASSTNALPADSTNYYCAYQMLISNYKYQMLSIFSAGSYTGPNIYITVPIGQFSGLATTTSCPT